MARLTLALKFAVYGPLIMGPAFLLMALIGDAVQALGTAEPQATALLAVAQHTLIPSILIVSYLAFGPPAAMTGLLAALIGPSTRNWEIYQAFCAFVCGALGAIGYMAAVALLEARSPHDRGLIWIAGAAGAGGAMICARLTRREHAEASGQTRQT